MYNIVNYKQFQLKLREFVIKFFKNKYIKSLVGEIKQQSETKNEVREEKKENLDELIPLVNDVERHRELALKLESIDYLDAKRSVLNKKLFLVVVRKFIKFFNNYFDIQTY